MNYRERRALWALIRTFEKATARDRAKADLIQNYAGGSNGSYAGEAEGTARPKGVPDGDEGWAELHSLYGSSMTSAWAAACLKHLAVRFGAFDMKRKPRSRKLNIKPDAMKRALRIVGIE